MLQNYRNFQNFDNFLKNIHQIFIYATPCSIYRTPIQQEPNIWMGSKIFTFELS